MKQAERRTWYESDGNTNDKLDDHKNKLGGGLRGWDSFRFIDVLSWRVDSDTSSEPQDLPMQPGTLFLTHCDYGI